MARTALIEVEDSGIGISPDVLPHVFEMFRRGPTAADAAPEGLGVGLALVKRLVELHGGTVSAHSEGVDRGARFSVRMPIHASGKSGHVVGEATGGAIRTVATVDGSTGRRVDGSTE